METKKPQPFGCGLKCFDKKLSQKHSANCFSQTQNNLTKKEGKAKDAKAKVDCFDAHS